MPFEMDIYPFEWGAIVHRKKGAKIGPVRQSDLKFLEELRERYKDYCPNPVPFKKIRLDYCPDGHQAHNELVPVMSRLWYAGYIEKFSTQTNTQSGRPSYIAWLLWMPQLTVNLDVPQYDLGENDA